MWTIIIPSTSLRRGEGYGQPQLIERSTLLEEANKFLINGALHIEVAIQVKPLKAILHQLLNPLSKNMLNLLCSGDDADVVFDVMGWKFRAHSFVLRLNAPILADFCESHTDNTSLQNSTKSNAVVINDVSPPVFWLILSHIYGDCALNEHTMLDFDEEAITAADKYGLVELKMIVENTLVQYCVINKTNVAEYLVLADSKNCSLLKEYATSYFLLHARDILKSSNSNKLRESTELLTELMLAMNEQNDSNPIVPCLCLSLS